MSFTETDRYKAALEVYHRQSTQIELDCKWLKENVADIAAKATKESLREQPLKVLAIGSGTGSKDTVILKELLPLYQNIQYTVIDSSPHQMAKFNTQVATNPRFDQVHFTLHTMKAEDYLNTEEDSYHVIHIMNTLYFLWDSWKRVIKFCWERLVPGGVLFTVHEETEYGALFFLFESMSRILGPPPVRFTAKETAAALTEMRIPFKETWWPGHLNVGVMFDDENEDGDLLLDIFCQQKYARTEPTSGWKSLLDGIKKASLLENNQVLLKSTTHAFICENIIEKTCCG